MFKALQIFFARFRKTDRKNKDLGEDTLDEQIAKSIEEFKNRPIYKKLTDEIIDKTSDNELLQVIFDNLSQKPAVCDEGEYSSVLGFSKPQQAIYVIWLLESEVNNGGFNQYYSNSSGEFAKLTPDALRLVGANRFAELVEKTNAIYETENEKITKDQDGTLEGFSKSYEDNPLNVCDDEFFELYQTEKLLLLQIDYIRKNKTEFVDI